VEGNQVVLAAEIRPETHGAAGQRTVYSERSYGRASRSFTLPAEVEDTGAEAKLEDGVLRLSLPKRQGGAAKRLTIQ
jgi:HSP20 family protein